MSVNALPSVASVATQLQQLHELRQEQTQVDLQAGEQIKRAREQAVDQSMQDLNKQVERVTEIKKAAIQARSGSIDVWA